MNYLLDTDICIFWLRGNVRAKEKIAAVSLDNLAICPITLAELYQGAYGSRSPDEHLAQIEVFTRPLHFMPLSDAALRQFGKLKTQLKRTNQLIGDFDLLIASIALVDSLILVTNNTQHYERVPGLAFENWLTSV